MMIVPKPLVKERYSGDEFKRNSVLRDGVTIEDIQERVKNKLEKNAQRRRKKPIFESNKKF